MHHTIFEPGWLTGGKNIRKTASVYLSQVTGCPEFWNSLVKLLVTQARTLTYQLPIYFVNNIWNVKSPSFPTLRYMIYKKQSPLFQHKILIF